PNDKSLFFQAGNHSGYIRFVFFELLRNLILCQSVPLEEQSQNQMLLGSYLIRLHFRSHEIGYFYVQAANKQSHCIVNFHEITHV
ncbi:MAG: hypothetical protein K0R47_5839, partial [Brevibacillus sp.]|nr:hypothetical protein [Brevibacillus sp.]